MSTEAAPKQATAASANEKNSNSDLEKKGKALGENQKQNLSLKFILTAKDDEECANLLKIALSEGADPNKVVYMGKYAIHIIMERGFVQSLRVLLTVSKINVKVTTSVLNTGIHCALQGLIDNKYNDESKGAECIQLLIEKDNSFIKSKNYAGIRAIQLAIHKKFWKISKCLIENIESLDQESVDKIKNENSNNTDLLEIKKMIQEMEIKDEVEKDLRLDFKIALENNVNSEQICETNPEIEEILKEICKDSNDINDSDKEYTYLQLAVENNCKFAVESLLKSGADVNLTTPRCKSTPAMIAVEQEKPEILQLLIDHNNCDLSLVNAYKRTVLHIAAIRNKDSSRCFDILIENAKKRKLNINSQDYDQCTALHIAAKRNKCHMVDSLLKNEANIFITDYENIPAFFEIAPKYINDFLDSKINKVESDKNSLHCDLIFNYDFLSQGIQSENKKIKKDSEIEMSLLNRGDVERNEDNSSSHIAETEMSPLENSLPQGIQSENQKIKNDSEIEMSLLNRDVERNEDNSTSHIAEPEMSPLEMLADSPNHRVLLKHPIIRAFLLLKWNRVQWFFYANCIFYLLFTVCLSCFISNTHAQTNCMNGSNAEDGLILTNDFTYNKTWGFWKISTAILLFILSLRELFQVSILCVCNYKNQKENWLEVVIIVLTFILILIEWNYIIYWQYIAALAIFFTYYELVLMLGRHPLFSTYIKMFITVFKTFIQLLLWYSLFIFGFSLSFYIVLKSCKTDDSWFLYYSTSLFKTIIMLTSEFESGEINFNSVAIASHIIFILFIFVVSIVLLNMLTGLAVDDIHTIRNDAELYAYIAQVQTIAQIEKVILIGGKLKKIVKNVLSDCIVLMPILKEKDEYKLIIESGGDKNKLKPKEIYGCCNGCIECSSFWRCVGARRTTCKMCFIVDTVVFDAREIVKQKESHQDQTDSKIQLLKRIEMLEQTLLNAMNK